MSVVANVAINVDSRNAVSKLRQVQTQSQATERAVEGLSRAFGGLAAAFGAGFALTKVIADVRELDTNLRRLGTVGVDVGKISPALSSLSKELGGVASKAELAAASYQAASAGFSDTAGNINILRAATKAAAGGLADTQAVTEVLVKTLNSYGMSGNQAIQVTDSISKAVELGNQEWSDYTSQLGRVASIAALAGVSLDEVNAFIASATKNGATAEIAFTGLGATLNTLLQPTKESQEAAAALGIAWNYGGLQAKGFTGLMAELAIAMEKDKETTAKLLGSQEAMRGAFAANAKGGRDYKMVLGELSSAAGKTDADFQTMKGSLDNQLKALDTAFKNLSEALGIAFGPTVVKTIGDVATAINVIADALNAVPQPVKTATAEIIKLVAQIILLDKAIKAIIGLRAAFIAAMGGMTTATVASGTAAKTGAGAFALYANNTRTMQAQAIAATPALNGMLLTLRNLAAIGAIAIVVNVAVTGMAAVYQAQAEIDRLRGVRSKGGAAAAFGGSATAEQKKTQQEVLTAVQTERQSQGFRKQQAAAAAGIGKTMARQRADQLAERERSARAILALPLRGTPTPVANAMGTPVGAAVGGGTTGGKGTKGKDDAERAAEEKRRAAEELANLQGQVTLKGKLFEIDKQIAIEKQRGSLITTAALEMDKALEERQIRIAEITRSNATQETKNAQIKEATVDADQKIFAVQQAIKEQEAERNKSFEQIIADLDLELALKAATTEEIREQLRLEAEIAKLRGQGFTPEQISAISTRKTELAKPKTDQQNITEKIKELKKEIADLTSISNIAITSAEGIGNAFAQSFQGLISGTMTAKEALGTFFKSVGDMFIEMATQIIAKQMTMIILQTILKALGAFGGGGGFTPLDNTAATSFGFNPGAMTGSLTPGGLFAEGGFVTGPTNAIIGEGGESEYVIPASKMNAAMERYSRGARGEGVIPGSGTDGGTTQSAAAMPGATPIDVRYTVERINNVEYVTAEQFRQGMRSAALEGASRGEQQTLRRLQNAPSARKRVGI